MSQTDANTIAVCVASLWNCFRQIPPAAVPAMLDCILASTGISSSSIFHSLVDAFPTLTKDMVQGGEKYSSQQRNFISSYVGALCHLLKKTGANVGDSESFVRKVFVPLMKLIHAHDSEILEETTDSFFNLVIETNIWWIVEATMVPLFLRFVGLSMGMLQSEESAIYGWDRCSVFQVNEDQLTDSDIEHNLMSHSGSFPLHFPCHILTSILDSTVQSQDSVANASKLSLANVSFLEKFAKKLLWDLCNMTVRMLIQSVEHRSCAIKFLLPSIFKAFVYCCAFDISVHGQTHRLSRNHFSKKLWQCCRTLFSLGPIERRDSYIVLSLSSSFSCIEGCEGDDEGNREERFDLRAEKEFWDQMKNGLVDKEGLVRKQSLHILKMTLQMNEGSQCYSSVAETISNRKSSLPDGLTKRGRWADEEAKSLGVGNTYNSLDPSLDSKQRWGAFFLLYEMLEEYGTHLVEAAWNHQITLLLQSSLPNDDSMRSVCGGLNQNQMEASADIFNWLAVLWERGFLHDNPQVRCLIMESFLGIEWKNFGHCTKLVPEDFVLGPFIQGINDPVHHKDFGIKGIYSSRTIEAATQFMRQYASCLNLREGISFLTNLGSVIKKQSFGRAGLMGLAGCIASAAYGVQIHSKNEVKLRRDDSFDMVPQQSTTASSFRNDKTDLLDVLRCIMESSKQHFNPNYRLQVCDKVLDAAALVMNAFDVSLEVLLHFISAVPREFTDYGGSLRVKVQEWLSAFGDKHHTSNCCSTAEQLLKSLHHFPGNYIGLRHSDGASDGYDDEDLDTWGFEAKRWARVLFLVIKEDHHVEPILMFIRIHGIDVCKENNHFECVHVKFFILVLSLFKELQILQERVADTLKSGRTKVELGLVEEVDNLCSSEISIVIEKFAKSFRSILEGLVSFAKSCCSIFWSGMVENTDLPCSIRGKLGGPSQRRLSSSATTAVLEAIMSVKAVASISLWSVQFESDGLLNFTFIFLWEFFWKIVSSPPFDSEIAAEISMAAYEALVHVLRAVVPTFSSLALNLIRENHKPSPVNAQGKPLLDSLVLSFLQNINILIAVEKLVRTRRAVLMNWKWICLEYLLSIPSNALENGIPVENGDCFFSDATLRYVFDDLVDSLENAGEGSVLPMLRSIRLVLELFNSGRWHSAVPSYDGVNVQMMWHLVRSSWILHINCNKRRVAPIAALLSSVLHYSVFSKECMHETDNATGPLKWFVEKLLVEGLKSPRTVRLAALHLTGLWLSNPRIIKYYMKELKLLTLYGSVAFDEDFEAELAENHDARKEVSLLVQSSDIELTEAFINTELYARVSVAVLFSKLLSLAALVGTTIENENFHAALESGKMFLLELLDFAVNDKDQAKELYKKYSGVHRRKIRVWQMICVLSQFVDQEILHEVTSSLYISLYRNNLPAVRQYLETFAINICLKFPSVVMEQLVSIFRDYEMRPQALSSYVFIAANVILHAPETVQSSYLAELIPPIIPLLTSHHHSLRGFTQLLVYQVLSKLLPPLDSGTYEILSLEKRCFEDLKSYLANNSDCARLRASMEGYLDAFNPKDSVTPAGIFSDRVEVLGNLACSDLPLHLQLSSIAVEQDFITVSNQKLEGFLGITGLASLSNQELEFECVPTSLMEQVTSFLNDVREDLRCSMAKDAEIIKNENFRINEDLKMMELSKNAAKGSLQAKDIPLDFQKKVTISKHDRQDADRNILFGKHDIYKPLTEMEKEDQLLDELLHSRGTAMEKIRGNRQDFILVASLINRVPNLAGLARTCEVFKAASLAIADANIVNDKQFQLISVTAEKWVPIIEVPVSNLQVFLQKKKREGFSILGLEQTANSMPLDQYVFPKKTVLVLGREKEGIPVDIIHILDACVEIPQLGVVRSLNVHVSGAIALWEYTRQQRSL